MVRWRRNDRCVREWNGTGPHSLGRGRQLRLDSDDLAIDPVKVLQFGDANPALLQIEQTHVGGNAGIWVVAALGVRGPNTNRDDQRQQRQQRGQSDSHSSPPFSGMLA